MPARARGVFVLVLLVGAVAIVAPPSWAGAPFGDVHSLYAPRGQTAQREGGARQPKIVGGNTTTSSKYPWQAALVYDASFGGSDLDRFFCGATLIHPYIVMTAAHCVFDTDPDCIPLGCPPQPDFAGGDGTSFLDANDVDVIVGRTTLTGSGGVEQNAFNVYMNGAYNPNTGENDIGYISLDPGNLGLKRILLAGPSERSLWATNRAQRITGYGTTSESGPPSDTLREAEVPIVDDSTCGSPGFYGTEFVPSVMVCAGFPNGGVDSCFGDSGGPLQAPAFGGAFRETGVTSFGEGCARPNKPGVYARVADQPLRGAVQSNVAEIENAEDGPADLNLNVIGSGARLPFGCDGKGATIAGFGTADVLNGTGGRDVIVGLGANDTIRGGGGRDIICGGPGNDRLIGDGGADRLFGNGGRDRCIGGAGRDKAAGCERRRSV